ncbi:MAG: hypothetical protein AB3N07_06885, partial [Ruegeria sp.]
MCNLYSNTIPVEAMRSLFGVSPDQDRLGNAEPLPAIYPKHMGPVVRKSDDGARELTALSWGFRTTKVSAIRLHNIRSELSDAVNKARVSGAKKFSTQMDPVLRMIDDKLDAVPGYRDARLGYGANKALDEAIEDGRKVFSGSAVSAMSPAELSETMASMSPAQKDAFRKGAREWVSALMGTSRNDAAAAWGAFEKGWNDQKLRLVLGHEAAEKVIKRLRAEKTFSGTRGDVLAGSQTQFRDEAAGALVDFRDVDTGRRPGPLSRAKRALDDVGNAAVDSVLYGPRRRNANAEIGGILSLQGKA